MTQLLGLEPGDFTQGKMTDDLRRLRLHLEGTDPIPLDPQHGAGPGQPGPERRERDVAALRHPPRRTRLVQRDRQGRRRHVPVAINDREHLLDRQLQPCRWLGGE